MRQNQERTNKQTSAESLYSPIPDDPPYNASKQFLQVYGAIAGSLLFTGLLITGIVANWHIFLTASNIFLHILLVLVVILLPLAVISLCLTAAVRGRFAYLNMQEELKAKQDERRRTNEAHEMQLYLAESRVPANTEGNRDAIYNRETGEVMVIPSGNFIQPVPHTYSPHLSYEYKDTGTRISEEPETESMLAGVTPPAMEYMLSCLSENALQVGLGVSLTTGKPFVIDLIEGTHYKIIGSSGFGKSCQAAAILEQATQTNDPDHLLIALLDLEHKTSRLFEHLPHVAELPVGRKRIPLVATTPEEVAQHFTYLRREPDRRDKLSQYDLEQERFLLIYVEEFLSLQRELDPTLKAQMLNDFTTLALRGRKYGLYFLACAQVNYADPALRDAMNQFTVNMAFTVRPAAARAAGFSSNELLKQNFAAKQKGQFVLETTGCTDCFR